LLLRFSSFLIHTVTIHKSRIQQDSLLTFAEPILNNLPPIEKYAQPKEQVFPLGWNKGTLGKVTSGTSIWTELNPKVPRVNYIGLHFVNKDTGWAWLAEAEQ
jgi:hypothetical protein